MQDEHVILSPIGNIAEQCWLAVPQHFPQVQLDAYVVMPNHLHGIVIMSRMDQRPSTSLGQVINSFKGAVSRSAGQPVLQSRYYDHIIRNLQDADRIREYIHHNPARWESDQGLERAQ